MLAILTTIFIGVLDPGKQIAKAKDAQKRHDITQIKNALDTYYNDANCYPVSVSFGEKFASGSMVYMSKLPVDPDCSSTGYCYVYMTGSDSCPQWNVVFARLNSSQNPAVDCPLTQSTNCLPPNFSSLGYNFCNISGEIDCSYIASHELPTPESSSTTTITIPGSTVSTITTTTTSTSSTTTTTTVPTPTPTRCPYDLYACTGTNSCNDLADDSRYHWCTIDGGTYTCYCDDRTCGGKCN